MPNDHQNGQPQPRRYRSCGRPAAHGDCRRSRSRRACNPNPNCGAWDGGPPTQDDKDGNSSPCDHHPRHRHQHKRCWRAEHETRRCGRSTGGCPGRLVPMLAAGISALMKGTLGRSTNKPVDNNGQSADGMAEVSGGGRGQSPPPYQQLVASSHSPLTRSINSITTAAEPDSVSEVESKHIRTTTAALPTEHLPNIGECSCTDAASRLVNPATDQLNAEGPPPPYSE